MMIRYANMRSIDWNPLKRKEEQSTSTYTLKTVLAVLQYVIKINDPTMLKGYFLKEKNTLSNKMFVF